MLTNRTMYKSDGSNYMLTCTKIVYGMTIVSEREREREREWERGEKGRGEGEGERKRGGESGERERKRGRERERELTFGLKGGSTTPFSKCVQLIVAKKGCSLMLVNPSGP